jgi:hypothetical protein
MSPIGIAIRDDDIRIAHLLHGVLLIHQFIQGCEDGHLPAFGLQFLGVLVEHVEEGNIGEVDGLEEGLELPKGDDASTVDVDHLGYLLPPLVALQALQEFLLGQLLDLYALVGRVGYC